MVHKKTSVLKIMITKEFREAYKIYCQKNGYNMSRRIREFMRKELKGES